MMSILEAQARSERKVRRAALGIFGTIFLAVAAFWGAAGYVVWHFVAKFW